MLKCIPPKNRRNKDAPLGADCRAYGLVNYNGSGIVFQKFYCITNHYNCDLSACHCRSRSPRGPSSMWGPGPGCSWSAWCPGWWRRPSGSCGSTGTWSPRGRRSPTTPGTAWSPSLSWPLTRWGTWWSMRKPVTALWEPRPTSLETSLGRFERNSMGSRGLPQG